MAGSGSAFRKERDELEDAWRKRVEEALHKYRQATQRYSKLLANQPDGVAPEPGSPLAQARCAQSEALQEYTRLLRIFSDLVLLGKPPDVLE